MLAWTGTMRRLRKTLSVLALGVSVTACVPTQPPYPNVVPIDTTGNFGAH
jgi:hypothetical protein